MKVQRIPARTVPERISNEAVEPSPLLRLARRIREEQGAEQTRAFLSAMLPFAAPGEIRRIGEGFGIPFESISAGAQTKAPQQTNERRPAANETTDRLRMLQTLMQLTGAMQGGSPDMGRLISLLSGINGG